MKNKLSNALPQRFVGKEVVLCHVIMKWMNLALHPP